MILLSILFKRSIILAKSVTNWWLDNLTHSATKKKPWCEAPELYYFQTVNSLLLKGLEIIKPVFLDSGKSFFFGLLPKKDHEIILPNPPDAREYYPL
jgi:hypothetical protein